MIPLTLSSRRGKTTEIESHPWLSENRGWEEGTDCKGIHENFSK